jgi:hypothetical protein
MLIFHPSLSLSEAVGHLEIMREKKMVKVEERDEKDYYSLET